LSDVLQPLNCAIVIFVKPHQIAFKCCGFTRVSVMWLQFVVDDTYREL